MGFLNTLFGSGKPSTTNEKELPFIPLNENEQLQDIVSKSKTKPQLIYKHSTRCGLSRMVLNQFKETYTIDDDTVDLYYLDVLDHRDVSNEVAIKFQFIQESPQLLVIKDESVTVHASHGRILETDLKNFL
ncbi:bacillithiol system redox-active protein YtxJ [Aestuariivivens sp. NBU2969]|uniref:bacillithiol system redox-active protein YtxJ n=1 Tax=Aestuariivivens sp. NBU2969 TaxID=2873267 RepID=UPI001CBDE102|nr:bacillithiol system redox-active protein YtxJ [Aestuariivivens sp. NBU2969]